MKKLSPKEETVLNYFWKHGAMFVKELLDLLDEPKPHYNTVSTIIRTLEEKGYIKYKSFGNSYQYYATVSETDYRNKSLNQVVDKYFGKSYKRVVSALIEEEKLSIEELQELIKQVRDQSQS